MKAEFLKTAKRIIEQIGSCDSVDCNNCPYDQTIKNRICHIDNKSLFEYCKNYIAENEEMEKIQSENEKMEKIQMTEDQAAEFVHTMWLNHEIKLSVGYLKESGYIKKSIVDEAEEILKDWLNGHDVKIDLMVHTALAAMEFLKAENQKLKTLDK